MRPVWIKKPAEAGFGGRVAPQRQLAGLYLSAIVPVHAQSMANVPEAAPACGVPVTRMVVPLSCGTVALNVVVTVALDAAFPATATDEVYFVVPVSHPACATLDGKVLFEEKYSATASLHGDSTDKPSDAFARTV